MQDAFLSDNLVCDNLIGKEEKVLCRQRCKRKNMTRELLTIHLNDEMDQTNTVVVVHGRITQK